MLLSRKGFECLFIVVSGLENRDYGCRGFAALTTRHPLASPISGSFSVGIVRSRIKATELLLLLLFIVLKLVVCILLRVLGQVQGFRLTQHWFEYLI
jgi:hypothetical protein